MKSKTEIQNKLNLTEAKPSLIQSEWLFNHQGSPLNAPMNRYITKRIIETYISIRKEIISSC